MHVKRYFDNQIRGFHKIMKKFAAAIAVAVLFAFAAPVFAATNPFMDVPMNHWAYDAIGQLAAHGILSGYPDGTYKGKQPTTRYEMASALARALAVVDMTKASKQDVEMLKKLVVEFKDELEALGVKVENLDERVSLLEDRLGGWHIHAQMRLDVNNYDDRDAPESENKVYLQRGRLWIERWFGDEENPMHAVIRMDEGNKNWSRFYVDIPFFFDTTFTAGRFNWELEDEYYIGGATALPATGTFAAYDSILTDRTLDGLGIQKQWGMGKFFAYVAHPSEEYFDHRDKDLKAFGAWELVVAAQLQFTERFGFDLGAQAFLGDNAEYVDTATNSGWSFDNLWTIYAGLRFNFNDDIALKGIFYHQQLNGDVWAQNAAGTYVWQEADLDSTNHWKLIVDVKQEALKFTSLWLEYGQMDEGFIVPTGLGDNGALFTSKYFGEVLPDDLKYWRAALGQTWNDKWATHLFYNGYNFDDMDDLTEWGLGVQYTYNPSVKFGLNFVKIDWDSDTINDDHVIRFRTQVTF